MDGLVNASPASVPKVSPAVRGGALDALRFLAALLIVLYHFGSEGPWKLWRVHPVFARGFLATDFFLLLSGYVLGRAYGPQVLAGRVTAVRFWLRRVMRVWPAHAIVLIVLAATVAVFNWTGTDAHSPTRFVWNDLPLQFFLVHAWHLFDGGDGWNLPSWSLSALIVCYAAFPFLWRGVASVRWAFLLPVIGLAGVLAFNALAWRLWSRPLYDLPFNDGLFRAAPLFALGACLARAVELGWPSIPVARALLWGGSAILVLLQLFGRFDFPSILCIAAIVLGAGRLPVTKPSRAIEEAAKLSFALFITHTFTGFLWFTAQHAAVRAMPIWLGVQWALWWLAFPAAMYVAWLFHKYVDQPLQDRLAPWLRGQPKAPKDSTPI
jgi:peptidoglycan/LPS O-acetylase OafA/YrhL